MKVVAVIPAHNEEKYIYDVIKNTLKFVDKVVVVDDGSKDKTYEIAKKTKAIVIKHKINLGKGSALQTGCKKALKLKPRYIILLDADGQHDPKEIPKIINKLKGGCDLVVGCREFNKNMPFLSRIGNYLISFVANLLFKIKISDTQSGYRGIKANVLKNLTWKSKGYFFDTEMLINAKKNKLKICEVKIKTIYHDRHKGTTIIDGIKIMLKMIKLAFKK